ncbi:MAG: hypothetical protein E7576_13025 [Ruminococcaceae bacterium]|nr:hypothetical protein [Oscillospiraceae bacterium]
MRSEPIRLPEHGNTKIIAHRGASCLECENTAAAFIAAGNRSYWGMETDIFRTIDRQFMCHHDESTGRICEQDLPIEKSTFDALRSLRLKDMDGKSDRAELCLCTPWEYRKICERYGKVCVPELVSKFIPDEIERLIGLFDGYLENTVFIAFDMANLNLVRRFLPEQTVEYLSSWWTDDLPAMLEERKMDLDIEWGSLTEDRVKACHERGIRVNCWTVDDPAKAEELISWGVDYITSNALE